MAVLGVANPFQPKTREVEQDAPLSQLSSASLTRFAAFRQDVYSAMSDWQATMNGNSPAGSEAEGMLNRKRYMDLEKAGVQCFEGFVERTYRLLYDFEDHFDVPKQPSGAEYEFPGFQLVTATKEGVIENMKSLMPKKGKGLFGFGFPQTIEPDKAQRIKEAWGTRIAAARPKIEKATGEDLEEEKKKIADFPESLPFIFQREDETLALVHVWTTNIDKTFKERFNVYDHNPTATKFEPQAVDELHTAMKKLFGAKAEEFPPKYAIAQSTNPNAVYIGKGRNLLQMLNAYDDIKTELKIVGVHADHFVCEVDQNSQDEKARRSSTKMKEFFMDADTMYALYTKHGGDRMACVKPWDLFEIESVLVSPNATTIPQVLLGAPIPEDFIHRDVVDLFLDRADRLYGGATETPKPIPIDNCIGPALKYAYTRVAVLWSQVMLTTFIFGYGLLPVSIYWSRIFCYAIFVCTSLPYGLYAEMESIRYFVVPWVQQVHEIRFPLWGMVSFKTFLYGMLSVSVIDMLSIQTNAFFAMSTWRRAQMFPVETALWQVLMKDSWFAHVPSMFGLTWCELTPGRVAVILWLFSAVQLFQLILDLPLCSQTINTIVDYHPEEQKTWNTPFRKTTFYEAFAAGAHAAGMSSFGCVVNSYPRGQIMDAIRMRRLGWEEHCIMYLTYAQRVSLRRMVIDIFLKQSLQIKFQVTLYGLHRALVTKLDASDRYVMYFHGLPVLVSFFAGSLVQADTVWSSMRQFSTVRSAVPNIDERSWVKDQSRRDYKYSLFVQFAIIIFAALAAWINIYSLMQFVMLHTCKVSLWNIDGCAYDDAKDEVLRKMTTIGFDTDNIQWITNEKFV